MTFASFRSILVQIIHNFITCLFVGSGVAQWLRHCATSRAFRDRIPVASVTGIFLVDTDRTMCPGVNSVSKKWVPGIPLGVKVAGAWGWRSTTLVVPNVKKSGALTYPDPLGPSRRPVVGETFTLLLLLLSSSSSSSTFLTSPAGTWRWPHNPVYRRG